ncbi:unnamed protein product [Nezara viridula]|uniref:Uncharacterized protein n=1 Tax=Nezara viridula TaxID=85310 RepID=A0A9P0H405_NEZVI|nr:unnamed protein product [Nezara viridula]
MPYRELEILRSSPGPSSRGQRDTRNTTEGVNESSYVVDENSARAMKRERRKKKVAGSLDLIKEKKLEMIELQKKLLLMKIRKELRHMQEEHAKKMELLDLKIDIQKKREIVLTEV